MNLKDRIEVLKTEQEEVGGNLERLRAFLNGEVIKTLNPIDAWLLGLQEKGMTIYYDVLTERIVRLIKQSQEV